MFVLITGGSKSGKSRLAEAVITGYQMSRYYIATMEPDTDEAGPAIERHRRMRAGKGFETIERYTDIGGICLEKMREQGMLRSGEAKCAALLECMGNLCANEMFSPQGIHAGTAKKVVADVEKLYRQTEVLVAVTNQVGADGMEYPSETMEYVRILGDINAALAKRADVVVEAVFGLPVVLKGTKVWEEIYRPRK